jgi:hypothetical protein
MVTIPAIGGAVRIPLEEIVPPDAVHITAVLKPPVPLTDAAHALVWPVWIELGVQVTVTEVIVGEDDGVTLPLDMAEPPPQPVSSRGTTKKVTITSAHRRIEHPKLILASRMNDDVLPGHGLYGR